MNAKTIWRNGRWRIRRWWSRRVWKESKLWRNILSLGRMRSRTRICERRLVEIKFEIEVKIDIKIEVLQIIEIVESGRFRWEDGI